MFLKILFLFLNFSFLKAYKISNGLFLKKYNIYSDINKLLKKEYNYPLILNGDKTLLKRDFCKYMCIMNDFNFK